MISSQWRKHCSVAQVLALFALLFGSATTACAESSVDELRSALIHAQAEEKFDEAMALASQLVDLNAKLHGTQSIEYALSLHKVALVHEAAGDLAAAAKQFKQALTVGEIAVGPDDPRLVSMVRRVGDVWRDAGKLDQAEQLYRRAMALREREEENYGSGALEHQSLAQLLVNQDRHAEAAPVLQAAIDYLERTKAGQEMIDMVQMELKIARRKMAEKAAGGL